MRNALKTEENIKCWISIERRLKEVAKEQLQVERGY